MLAADVSRINFPALSTISGVEKLASFFLVSFLLFFKARDRHGQTESLAYIVREILGRDRVSGTVLSQRFQEGWVEVSFCAPSRFLLHQRYTPPFHGHGTQRFRGRTRKCWKFIFLEVGPTCFQRGGCNLRYKRFEGLISGVVGRNFRKFQ